MVIIDAGHGGYDPGGGSNEFFKEKDINLKISKYEAKRLNDLGIKTVLVRNNDVTLTPAQRINEIAKLKAGVDDILISNHINTGNDVGGEVIYSIRGNKELPSLIAKYLNQEGLPIRNVYQKRGKTGKDFYFLLRETDPKNALIIEYGFADNEADTKRILYNWPDLAEAVVKAIAEYLDVPYKKPTYVLYIVKPGDTLGKIAQKYNTTIDEIKKNNGLTSNEISPQMELKIYK